MDYLQLQRLAPSLDTALIHEIASETECIEVAAQTQLLDIGTYVNSVPFVINGLIRVSRKEEDKELLLYHIYPGELCIMSFTACCSNTSSLIVASTVETTTLLLLPSTKIRSWIQTYPSLNYFIFNQFNTRYLDLIDTINQLIFNNLEDRLIKYLEEKSLVNQLEIISVTHQQIANDLGTAREVISRLMKKLERDGRLELGRNLVRLKKF